MVKIDLLCKDYNWQRKLKNLLAFQSKIWQEPWWKFSSVKTVKTTETVHFIKTLQKHLPLTCLNNHEVPLQFLSTLSHTLNSSHMSDNKNWSKYSGSLESLIHWQIVSEYWLTVHTKSYQSNFLEETLPLDPQEGSWHYNDFSIDIKHFKASLNLKIK